MLRWVVHIPISNLFESGAGHCLTSIEVYEWGNRLGNVQIRYISRNGGDSRSRLIIKVAFKTTQNVPDPNVSQFIFLTAPLRPSHCFARALSSRRMRLREANSAIRLWRWWIFANSWVILINRLTLVSARLRSVPVLLVMYWPIPIEATND